MKEDRGLTVLSEMERMLGEIEESDFKGSERKHKPGEYLVGQATSAIKRLWTFRVAFLEKLEMIIEEEKFFAKEGMTAENAFRRDSLLIQSITVESYLRIVDVLLALEVETTFAEGRYEPFSIAEGWGVFRFCKDNRDFVVAGSAMLQ